MKRVTSLLFALLMLTAMSCITEVAEESSPLEGVWKLVSAEWGFGDSAIVVPNPDFKVKSIKHYSDSYWVAYGQVKGDEEGWALGGKYEMLGEGEYKEHINLSINVEMEETYTIKYEIVGDTILKLTNEMFKEEWKRLD